MKILLGFDTQFCGKSETVIEAPNYLSKKEIKELFKKEMGIEFDENCYYEILGERE